MRGRTTAVCLALLLFGGCASGKKCAYEGWTRDGWQQPQRVVEALGLEPGARVADLGSGTGYFTIFLARALEPEGRVYAVDVDEEANAYLRQRAQIAGLGNVEVVLGRFEDPLLPDGAIDLIFTSNTYHHIDERAAYFRRVQQDLAPGGRVAVVEYDGRRGLWVKLVGHYTPKQEIVREMEEAGYRLEHDHDFLDRQSFLIFRVAGDAAAPP